MTETQTGKVVIVIPNYNGGEAVRRCLTSLLEQTYSPIEIIVVDNDSRDGSREIIERDFPNIRLIKNRENVGFGVACNQGMQAAESEYVLFFNNDAYMEKDCVHEMVQAVSKDPLFGSCASRVLLWDTPDKAEVCGLMIYPDGSAVARGRLGPANKYMEPEEVFCPSGSCCLYRREMIDKIGAFDPDFFAYCEDSDMGWRIQLSGWKCIYAPGAVAYHAHSQSAGSYSPLKAFLVERNRILITLKYFPVMDLIRSFFYAARRYFYQFYLSTIKKKGALAQFRKQHSLGSGLWILLKAHASASAKLPLMLRRRREWHENFSSPETANIHTLFKRYGVSAKEMASYE